MNCVKGQIQPATRIILTKLYSGLPVVGKSGKVFESRPALSTTRNLNEIVEILCRSRPENTLEVGMAFGGSSLIFADVGRTVYRDLSPHRDRPLPEYSLGWRRYAMPRIGRSSKLHRVVRRTFGSGFATTPLGGTKVWPHLRGWFTSLRGRLCGCVLLRATPDSRRVSLV